MAAEDSTVKNVFRFQATVVVLLALITRIPFPWDVTRAAHKLKPPFVASVSESPAIAGGSVTILGGSPFERSPFQGTATLWLGGKSIESKTWNRADGPLEFTVAVDWQGIKDYSVRLHPTTTDIPYSTLVSSGTIYSILPKPEPADPPTWRDCSVSARWDPEVAQFENGTWNSDMEISLSTTSAAGAKPFPCPAPGLQCLIHTRGRELATITVPPFSTSVKWHFVSPEPIDDEIIVRPLVAGVADVSTRIRSELLPVRAELRPKQDFGYSVVYPVDCELTLWNQREGGTFVQQVILDVGLDPDPLAADVGNRQRHVNYTDNCTISVKSLNGCTVVVTATASPGTAKTETQVRFKPLIALLFPFVLGVMICTMVLYCLFSRSKRFADFRERIWLRPRWARNLLAHSCCYLMLLAALLLVATGTAFVLRDTLREFGLVRTFLELVLTGLLASVIASSPLYFDTVSRKFFGDSKD